MNCPKCGSLLPQGAQFCNVCNEPVMQAGFVPYGQPQQVYGYQQPAQGFQPQSQPGYDPAQGFQPQSQPSYDPAQGYAGQQGYPQGFQQSYATYSPQQQQSYPQGFQPIYGGYAPTPNRREPGAFLAALSQIPRMFIDAFRDPGTVLQGMMERHDFYTPPVISFLALLLAFLCGMLASRGLVTVLVSFLASLSGLNATLASTDGINRLANSIGASVGGIAALCQLLAMLCPMAVMLVYFCAVCKVRFSLDLLCGIVTLLTLPTLPAALLTMLTSLFSPLLPLLFMAAGMVMAYVFMGSLTARITGKADNELVRVKMVMILVSMALSFALIALTIGLLSGGVFSALMARMGVL